ncbi:DinB family protein [Aquiflexum sp. LQ15W]|uniref:DinB family protein n=1 Tax=Cognataquiflexum nitidum TaxID=2922272 RepID=UPI001F145308|nr:DinB family protein [Cognataquiflexum nitidum]MCH6202046.1 DinB family protein [Cognataquiflexum nitidum]
MKTIHKLLQEVSTARKLYLDQLANVSEVQALWKPDTEVWNVVEITEHLYWAEQTGIFGMWKTLHAYRKGRIVCTYDSPHKVVPIEQIINKTWQSKEKVPAVAVPRLGGPLVFWKNSLNSLQFVLEAFAQDIQEEELRVQAQPHPISGALDFHQRFEFLRFHIDRHREQVSQLLK